MSEVTVDAGVAGAVHTPVEQDTAIYGDYCGSISRARVRTSGT